MAEALIADERIGGVDWLTPERAARLVRLSNLKSTPWKAGSSSEPARSSRWLSNSWYSSPSLGFSAYRIGFSVGPLDNLPKLREAYLRDRQLHSLTRLVVGHAGGGIDNPLPNVFEIAPTGLDNLRGSINL